MVGRQFEPVRIEVRADEAEVANRVFQIAQALHAAKRIDPSQPRKTLRVARTDRMNALIGYLERAPNL